MPRIHIRTPAGAIVDLDAQVGESLMQVAVRHGVDGIIGECGGELSCATCHVHIDADQVDLLPPPSSDELDMFELLDSADHTSRLGCQIRLTPGLEGLRATAVGSQL